MTLFADNRSEHHRNSTYSCSLPSASSTSSTQSLSTSRSAPPAIKPPELRTSLHANAHTSDVPLAPPSSHEDVVVDTLLQGVLEPDAKIDNIDEAMYNRIKAQIDLHNERLRVFYDVKDRSIIIDTLPSDIHESIQEFLTDSFKFSLRQWISSFIPKAKVTTGGSPDTDMYGPDGVRLKGKTPDQAFRIRVPGFNVRCHPNIISEIGYSERYNMLVSDARRWLCETPEEPVLCVLLFWFCKPSKEQDFADLTKWKASLEVWERDPDDATAAKKFNGPISFLPIRTPPPTFQLALRQVLPREQIPEGISGDCTQNFPITYDESDIQEAIAVMMKKKRARGDTSGEYSADESARVPEPKRFRDNEEGGSTSSIHV